MHLRGVPDGKCRTILDQAFASECSCLFDRSRAEVDARRSRGTASQRGESEVASPTPEV
jgi:hypothetical protein